MSDPALAHAVPLTRAHWCWAMFRALCEGVVKRSIRFVLCINDRAKRQTNNRATTISTITTRSPQFLESLGSKFSKAASFFSCVLSTRR